MQIHTNQPAILQPLKQRGPFHMKPVARRNLHHLLRRGLVQCVRIAKEHNRILRQMLQQRCPARFGQALEQPHLAAGRKRHVLDLLARHLALRIEEA